MATTPEKPSFSRGKKWSIGFNVVLAVIIVFALAIMANYLSGRYFHRFFTSTQTRIELSPRTVSLLRSITNSVAVTLYYDKEDPLFGDVSGLLKEYHAVNRKLTVTTVDYYRDPGGAMALMAKYHLTSSTNKNFVIFDCEGRTKIVDGSVLAQYTLEQVPNDTEREFRRKPVAFNGEMMFSAAVLAVINPAPLKAYALEGHGEHSINDTSETGYSTFGSVLKENYIQVEPLSLLGSNSVPEDCNLLIAGGPAVPIPDFELEKIDQYLAQGGRLLALFDARSAKRDVGLEKILAKWGVNIAPDLVVDPEHMASGKDLVVSAFSLHPAVNAAVGSGLYMILPRPVSKGASNQVPENISVQEIAFTGANAYLNSDSTHHPARLSVMAAVENNGTKAVVGERGMTRMLVAGDSFFLDNGQIGLLANRDFLNSALNWLLERDTVLAGVGPRKVTEYRLVIPKVQMQKLQWILLGAIPGGVLFLGGLVWLCRRK
jgi:hypothetical protein